MRWMVTIVALPAALVAGSLPVPEAKGAEPRAPASSKLARNSAFIEIGGPGILYSANYERFVLPRFGVRLGVSLFGLRERSTGDALGVFTVPVTAQYLFFPGSHHLELGLGVVAGVLWSGLNGARPTPPFGLVAATATVGYRYQPPRSGFLLRVAFTPLYAGERFSPLGLPVTPWGSVSVGWAF